MCRCLDDSEKDHELSSTLRDWGGADAEKEARANVSIWT